MSKPPSPASEKYTILVVEDDPILRAQVKDYLEEEGSYVVLLAPSARSAFDQLATTRPDLVILDLVLPDRSGYEVAEHIRQDPRTQDVPVLAVSARLQPSHRAQAEEAGATAFLGKPVTKRELLRQLRALLPGSPLEVTKS
jgi:twitching motility two-component system response regulator PilH